MSIRSMLHRVRPGFLPSALASAALALPLAAQGGTAVVAIDNSGSTALFEVDLTTGALGVLPSFPSAGFAPRALAIDPIDRNLLLALDTGSATQIVRLLPGGAAFQETVLGTVPRPCTGLLVDRLGNIAVAVGGAAGGVHRVDRHGGGTSRLRSLPFATALHSSQQLAWSASFGVSGSASPPRAPAVGELELDGGQIQQGPDSFPGFTPLGITGVALVPTNLRLLLLSHDDGSFSIHSFTSGVNPVPISAVPVLPPGGAARMKIDDLGAGFVLGDAGNPQLWTFDVASAALGTMVLTAIGAPLPGATVDFAVRPRAIADVKTFAPGCGTAAELRIGRVGGAGDPALGNGGFAIGLFQAQPLQAALLVLGFLEAPLFTLPNGCPVLVAPAAAALHVADGSGEAAQPLPVPPLPALIGTILYGQWFQDDFGLPFATTPVAAIQVGP